MNRSSSRYNKNDIKDEKFECEHEQKQEREKVTIKKVNNTVQLKFYICLTHVILCIIVKNIHDEFSLTNDLWTIDIFVFVFQILSTIMHFFCK